MSIRWYLQKKVKSWKTLINSIWDNWLDNWQFRSSLTCLLFIYILIIPIEDLPVHDPSSSKLYPVLHEHVYEPMVLWQLCWHVLFSLLTHSSISGINITVKITNDYDRRRSFRCFGYKILLNCYWNVIFYWNVICFLFIASEISPHTNFLLLLTRGWWISFSRVKNLRLTTATATIYI